MRRAMSSLRPAQWCGASIQPGSSPPTRAAAPVNPSTAVWRPTSSLGALLGIAVDSVGNVYFVDRSHAVVRKVAPDGTISTVAGTGTNGFSGDGGMATAAGLNSPIGIACDTAGNVVHRRVVPGRIRKITIASGIINTVAGGGTLAPGNGVPPLQVNISQRAGRGGESGRRYLYFAPNPGVSDQIRHQR